MMFFLLLGKEGTFKVAVFIAPPQRKIEVLYKGCKGELMCLMV